jgi:Fe-S-cluster-containing dehydrogenase component/DMSO reductase anchor subunit
MGKGFLFDHNKCVACNACSAACIQENGWSIHAREVLTYNPKVSMPVPLTNISIACNHCEIPVCLEGCPSSVYSRHLITGAVIVADFKCIGCSYCEWNCPYGAPKFDTGKRIIGKCNLCYTRLIDGHLPACSEACPTGALSFGDLDKQEGQKLYSLLPDKNLNPAIRFTGNQYNSVLREIPEKISKPTNPDANEWNGRPIIKDRSLLIFSYLSTISVSTIVSSVIKGAFPDKILFLLTIIVTGLASFFHLGRKFRAWRAVSNFMTSPLSREIALFILYISISTVAVLSEIPGLLFGSAVIGLLFLVSIDRVYTFADNRKSLYLHSGQTFLTGLLISSYFSGAIFPFIFISIIKLAASANLVLIHRSRGSNFVLRFLRIALLLITCASFISDVSHTDIILISLFLTGELFDRIIFYIDFKPLNINTLIGN